MSTFTKVLAISVATMVVATGCKSPKEVSPTVVSPLTTQSYYQPSGYVYTGEALVQNSPEVQQAAPVHAVVHFAFDSDVITSEAASILNEHVAFLTQNSGVNVQIAGHTDERGSREYNMSLGERRAAAVRGYLAEQGVSVNNVHIVSFGEEQPVNPNSNEAAWAENRRAELSY